MSKTYTEKLTEDLLEQFRGKPNTTAVIKAIAAQMQDLYVALEGIREAKNIELATGKQLDMIGDIVKLTRQEAGAMGLETISDLSDDMYRRYLKYKLFINSNRCTYKEVMQAMKQFWPYSPLVYSESLEKPATIHLSTVVLDPTKDPESLFMITKTKAAGVAVEIEATTGTTFSQDVGTGGSLFEGLSTTHLPQITS